MIDVLVAGGGPIGLATAITARQAGLAATVVEPRADAIDKACGEGLMPDTLARLRALGVDPPGVDFRGIRYVDGTRSAEARFTLGPGRGVRRTTLSAALRQRAHDVGVDFVDGKVTEVSQTAHWVVASGLRCRHLVAADGLHSSVRTLAGLARPSRGPQRFGLRQHFRVAPWTDLVEVHWLPHAEVYLTPVAGDVVGVAVLGGRPLDLPAAVAGIPELSRRLSGARPASSVRGAGPLRQSTSARTSGRVLLVGDAAGYVDALTGEGLRVGLAEAEAAVAAIVRDDAASYEADWRRITRSYRLLTGGLVWAASHHTTRSMIVPAAAALPRVFGRIVDSLAA